MNAPEENAHIVCLNYCRADPETGYCQTCGRPPIPVSGVDLLRPSFGGIDLAKLMPSSAKPGSSGDC